jgi:hypothetical protein
MASCARDANVDYEINWPEKVVTVSMTTNMGKPFFSAAALAMLVEQLALPDREAIQLADADQEGRWQAVYSDWKIIVRIGAVQYRARAVRQVKYLGGETVVELQPMDEPPP